MATPQWRSVDAPDFGSAMRGFQISQGLIGNAFSGLDGILAGVQANRDRRADSTVMQNLLAQGDPDAFRAALADGSIYGGVDRSRLSDGVMTALANRTGVLQGQRTSDQTFAQNQYTNDRARQQNAAEDAAAPIVGQILAAQARGDQAGARKIASNNAGVLSALSFDRQGRLVQDQQGTQSRFLGNEQAAFNLNQSRETAADTKAANTALNQAVLNSVDPQSALAEYARVSRELGANAAAQFRGGLESRFPGMFGPQGAAGAASGAVGTMTGGAQLPANIRTVGDIVNNKASLLGTNPRGTATGLYQITSDTWKEFGPKALGKDWESADIRDPQVQDKVAESIWNSAKGSATKINNRWASISPNQAQSLVGKSWADVRDTISRGETSTNASSILQSLRDGEPGGSNIAQELIESTQRRFTQNNVGNSAQRIAALEGDQRSVNDLAKNLVGEDGAMSGRTAGAAVGLLNQLTREYGINPAQAAALIEDNQRQRGIPERAFGGVVNALSFGTLGRPLSQSQDIDENQLRAAAEQIRSGGSLQQLGRNRNLTDNLQDIAARQTAVNNAAAGYQLAQQRLDLDPQNPTLIALAQDRYQKLQLAQQGAGGQNVASGTNADVNALLRAVQERRQMTPEDVILIEAQAPGNTAIPSPVPAGRGRGLNW